VTWNNVREAVAWLSLGLAVAAALPAAFVLLVELLVRGSAGVAFPVPRGAWGAPVRAVVAAAMTLPAATLLVALALAAAAWRARP
jgi:hypothetical protein